MKPKLPPAKEWFRSTTILVNLIPFVVVMIDALVKSNLITNPTVLIIIMAILNILNRLRVHEPVQPISSKLI